MSALTMPCLTRSGPSAVQPMMIDADGSLYDSLLDLLCSASSADQLAGLNSLALCLDGSHPRAGKLLEEVAAKLEHHSGAVKFAAAKAVARLPRCRPPRHKWSEHVCP
jgi:hypothetical protein